MSLLDNYIESLEIGQGTGNQGLEHVQVGFVFNNEQSA